MTGNGRTHRIMALVGGAFLLVLALLGPDARFVAAPFLACTFLMVFLWVHLWERDGAVPFLDLGMFCVLATWLYSVYPLLNYGMNGFEFGIAGDGRLRSYELVPEEVFVFHLRHILYLGSLVASYAYFRVGSGRKAVGFKRPGTSTLQVAFLLFAAMTLYFIVLEQFMGIRIWTSYESDAFARNVMAIANTSPMVFLISAKIDGILFLVKLLLMLYVISRFQERKWRVLLVVWILWELTNSLLLKGPRTGLILFLLSAGLMYHKLVRPIPGRVLLVSGVGMLLFFNFFGLYRQYSDLVSLRTDFTQLSGTAFSANNEFQALFGTSYDVLMRKEAGAPIPWYLYLNDFNTLFPPQHWLPFERVPAAEWYLRELGLSGSGQGFMWGVITQAIVGLDWWELAPRGAALGFILAKIHNWYVRHQDGYLETVIYLVLCLKIYNTFRNTTLSPMAVVIWEILPFILLLKVGRFLLERLGKRPAALPA